MAGQHPLHEPFHDIGRQHEADRLGMLLFLASEVMLFGGIFAAALALRLLHPADYAQATKHLHLWLGGANTAILLTSSTLAAAAVAAARAGRPRSVAWRLASASALGLLFLLLKAYEYRSEYREGLVPGLRESGLEGHVQELFMNLYFAATGLHALHLTAGIALLLTVAMMRRAREDRAAILVGNAALYWHLVDIIWVFLYPTLYLARP